MLNQPTDIDDIAPAKHKLTGKRGPWLEANCKDGITRYFIQQLRGDDIIRGRQRKGIKAADFTAEAVWTNEQTSPRVEIPRVVIETMEFDNSKLATQDVALFWFLFAYARHSGIADETHTVSLAAIKGYLNVKARARILASFQKLYSATMSLHVNMPDAHGRIDMPMVDNFYILGDEITFTLPTVLRHAALHARDYAWVDINAIARFESKFTAALYLKLCLEAGKHWSKRSTIEDSRAEFRDRVGLPEGTKANVLEDVLNRVRADLLAISGPRRRFKIGFDLPTSEGLEGRIYVQAGNSARSLKEVKPQGMTRDALVDYSYANKRALAVPAHRWPNLVRFRQAATLLHSSVLMVADMWRLDVYGAQSYPDKAIAGLTGAEFLALVDAHGPDDVLEFWVDKRDFAEFPAFHGHCDLVDVGVAVDVRKPLAAPVAAKIIEAKVVEAEYVADDDISMGDDYAHLSYGDEPTPDFETAAVDDIDDCDIPY